MLIYQDYAKELLTKTDRLSELIKHSSSIGVYLEHLISNFLKGFLGNRFSVKTGFIRDSMSGKISKQIDIMIIDENIPSPYLFKDDNFVIAFPDSVACTIEIKQKFNKKSFDDIIKQTSQLHEVCSDRVRSLAFCYENTLKNDTPIYQWYKEAPLSDNNLNYPWSIFVLDSYMIQYFFPHIVNPVEVIL
jgi:hypothetical protein